ncbi:sensor histidine kinase [Streptomyces sp. NPDC005438]|uniref:sensor histidine kinase n=1 Tax=Streptomyces sp. NPDC005438 TaxID=3156880 RepID=UPI0033B0BFEC
MAKRLADGMLAGGAVTVIVLANPESLYSAYGHLAVVCCIGISFVAGARYRHGIVQQVWSSAYIQGEENARSRIARDLHDDTLQNLATARMSLRMALRDERPETLAESAAVASRLLDEQIRAIRSLSHDLMPSHLAEKGLAAAVEHLAQQVGSTWQIAVPVTVQAGARGRRASPAAELTAYRVLQEALNNAVRHSGATEVRIRVRLHRYCVLGEVTDDGRGFDPSTATSGIGISGMRERVGQCEGSLTIRSRTASDRERDRDTPHGTTVRFLLPARPGGQLAARSPREAAPVEGPDGGRRGHPEGRPEDEHTASFSV